MHWFKAVDEGIGEVVGVCSWRAPKGEQQDAAKAGDLEQLADESEGELPRFVKKEVFGEYDEMMKVMKEELGLEARKDFWCE